MTTRMKSVKTTTLEGLNIIPLMMDLKEKRIWTKDGITIINRYQLATLVRQRKSKRVVKLSNSSRLSFQNSLSQISELEQQIAKLVNRPTIDTDEVGNGETSPAASKPLLVHTLVLPGKELNTTRAEQVGNGKTSPAASKPLLVHTLVLPGKELNTTRAEQVGNGEISPAASKPLLVHTLVLPGKELNTTRAEHVGNGEISPAASKPLLVHTLVLPGKELNTTRAKQGSTDDNNGQPDNWANGDKLSETAVKSTSSDNVKESKTQNVNNSIPQLANKTKSTEPISIRFINVDETTTLGEKSGNVTDNVYDNAADTFILYDCQAAHARTHRQSSGVPCVLSPRSASEPRKANGLTILSLPMQKSADTEHADDIPTCSKGIEVETREGECSLVILENLSGNKRPLGIRNKLPEKYRVRDNNSPTNRIKESCRMFLDRQKRAQNSKARQVNSDEAMRGRHRREEEGKKGGTPSRIKQSYQRFVDRHKMARSNKPNTEEDNRTFIF